MQFDKTFDIETYLRLAHVAVSFDHFNLFQVSDKTDGILRDHIAHYRATCDDYDRPTAYRRFQRLSAYAYHESHPGDIYKVFFIGSEYAGVSYTLEGEGYDEEIVTKEHIAHRRGITPDMVTCGYEQIHND